MNSSAFNSYLKYAHCKNITISFPFSIEDACGYTSWALLEKNLQPSTVTSYLSSLATIHKLKGVTEANLSHFAVKTMIRGAENLALYANCKKETRKVMTLPLLKLLGHQIAISDWSENSKQLFWTCCLISFFGSFRIGELLACNKNRFVPGEALTWGDITFRGNDSILVHIKISKNRSVHGETVDLFKFNAKGLCPVRALQKLRDMCKNSIYRDRPVFEFDNGVLLTPAVFNKCIQDLLRPHLGPSADMFTSHSFCAALPSAMGSDPVACKSIELKQWGQWYSDSYLLYTRLKLDQKRALFYKIVDVLNKLQA